MMCGLVGLDAPEDTAHVARLVGVHTACTSRQRGASFRSIKTSRPQDCLWRVPTGMVGYGVAGQARTREEQGNE